MPAPSNHLSPCFTISSALSFCTLPSLIKDLLRSLISLIKQPSKRYTITLLYLALHFLIILNCLTSVRYSKMKAIKVKKLTNNSFVTNHDLLECLRNKSFVATRQNSTRLHTTKSKVSLLEKKSYERLHTLQENNSMVANTSQFMPSVADKAVILVQDCITSLGEGNQKIVHKLKKALAYIREIHEEHQREEESRQKIEKEGEKALLRKLEVSYQEKAVLKIQNEEFKHKLAEYREKLNLLRREKKEKEKEVTANPNPNAKNVIRQEELHELIINQNQLIDRQTQQHKQREEQLQRVLKIQALQIQEMMKRKPPIGPSPRVL